MKRCGSVKQKALRDISQHLQETANYNSEKSYLVSYQYLDTKENRRLNKELGLNKVNYFNNKNR